MVKETVLIIEDEKNIVELIKFNLEKEGFLVQTAFKGDTGLEKARREKPSLIILDLMLPEIDGFEIIKILKQNYRTATIPILILSAKGEETDKILGLELGADDYVSKPFSPRELTARVKAILRRGKEQPADKVLKCGGLQLDTAKYLVTLKDKKIDLTTKEFELLKAMLEANGRTLSRESLLKQVWGYEDSLNVETRTVDMHIGQLRKKLKTEGDRIVTIKNVGYRFDDDL